jgi:hypothetical protein
MPAIQWDLPLQSGNLTCCCCAGMWTFAALWGVSTLAAPQHTADCTPHFVVVHLQAFQLIAANTAFTGAFGAWAEAQSLQISLMEYWASKHRGSVLPDTESAVEALMDKLPHQLQLHHVGFMEAYV